MPKNGQKSANYAKKMAKSPAFCRKSLPTAKYQVIARPGPCQTNKASQRMPVYHLMLWGCTRLYVGSVDVCRLMFSANICAKECQWLPTNQAISNDILALALAAKLYFDVRFSGWHWHWLPAYILACTLIVYGYVDCQTMPNNAK